MKASPSPSEPLLSLQSLSRFFLLCLSFASYCCCLILEVASPVSFPPHWATFFGPYRSLLGVRASGWSARFEECMIVSAEALGLEEDFSRVEASVADLITVEEAGDMAGSSRTWDFGPSLMTKDIIEELW